MDKYFALNGRIIINVDEPSLANPKVKAEVEKTAISLAEKGHAVFIVNESGTQNFRVNSASSYRFVFIKRGDGEQFCRVFKPSIILSKVKEQSKSSLVTAAKKLKIPVGSVPGSTNVKALESVSKKALASKIMLAQGTGSSNATKSVTNSPTAAIEARIANQIILTKEPIWYTFPVDEFLPHSVQGELVFHSSLDMDKRACLARVVFLNSDGSKIEGAYAGCVQSKAIGNFSYLPVDEIDLVKLTPPKGAAKVKVGFQKWNAKQGVKLINGPKCEPLILKGRKISTTFNSQPMPAKSLRELRVAGILDEFTADCFSHEVKLNLITPQNWRSELERERPDLLFVESCWFGNNNTWSGLIFGYSSNGQNQMDELVKLINYCRSENIPTAFWAKEDPVHFSRFAPTAKLFDFVFTTDADMVTEYETQFGIEAQPLSFFCQPKIHNPVQNIPRNQNAAFAGSYYSDKKERCENFHTIMDALELADVQVDIYDRCFDRGLAHFAFPEKYAGRVIGNLKPHEMWRAYKGYRYTVNLNTVKHSPTMFARRVYESLASGTPVISNYSEGVRTQFGGIVCASDDDNDILDYLDKLQDEATYNEIAKLGVRETLARHTLADRLEQVCERMGISVKPHLPMVNLEVTAFTDNEVEQAIDLFEQQTYLRKRLVVNLENSNELYPYLNRNTEDQIFRVKTEFAKPLDGIVVEHSLSKKLASAELEDVAISTQYSNQHAEYNGGSQG